MKSSNWMPLYVADYLSKTGRLTTEGHGAYMLLIMEYWQAEEALPDDDEQLAAITRMPVAKWSRVRPVLAGFFRVEEGRWRHDRIEDELAHARQVMEKRSKAGIASADKRAASAPTPEPTHVATHDPSLVDTTYRVPKEDIKNLISDAVKGLSAPPASRANYDDPAARKDRWLQKLQPHVIRALGPTQAMETLALFQKGDPLAKQAINAIAKRADMSTRRF